MRRVLVTGGAGFIGSHLAKRLLADGFAVTVLDNLATGSRENVPDSARFVGGDVADRSLVEAVFADETLDAVFHLAGQASISRSFAEPEIDLGTNVLGTVNVVRACIEMQVPRLLHASSMTIYGEPDRVPTPEEAACIPVSYYGVTKYAAERFVHVAGDRDDVGLEVTSLRMFNVYGPGQSITNPYQGVLAIFIGNVMRGEPITVHGDGLQTRDFVYVDDVAEAWMHVLDLRTSFGRALNVGGGRETSINDLADAVLQTFGHSRSEWRMSTAPAQLGDQRRSAADTSALEGLGWRARTTLRDGIARTVAWAEEPGVRS